MSRKLPEKRIADSTMSSGGMSDLDTERESRSPPAFTLSNYTLDKVAKSIFQDLSSINDKVISSCFSPLLNLLILETDKDRSEKKHKKKKKPKEKKKGVKDGKENKMDAPEGDKVDAGSGSGASAKLDMRNGKKAQVKAKRLATALSSQVSSMSGP